MKARDVLLVLAGAVGALAIAGIVLFAVDGDTATAPTPTTTPTQNPSPTAYQRRLTGAEAEARVKDQATEDYTSPVEDVVGGWRDCEALDFNESTRNWVVRCDLHLVNLTNGKSTIMARAGTWLLRDSTGEIIERLD